MVDFQRFDVSSFFLHSLLAFLGLTIKRGYRPPFRFERIEVDFKPLLLPGQAPNNRETSLMIRKFLILSSALSLQFMALVADAEIQSLNSRAVSAALDNKQSFCGTVVASAKEVVIPPTFSADDRSIERFVHRELGSGVIIKSNPAQELGHNCQVWYYLPIRKSSNAVKSFDSYEDFWASNS